MKSVLISIQPKWCELIANGTKTVEVRKTKPKLDAPFKCYIYCTANKKGVNDLLEIHGTDGKIRKANGKVIGEFVCNCVVGVKCDNGYQAAYNRKQNTCLSDEEIMQYANNGKVCYWHISDLVIYDKPKELSEFYHYCGDNPKCDGCEAHYYSSTECGLEDYCCSPIEGCKPLKRPPQSWCYVEKVGEG